MRRKCISCTGPFADKSAPTGLRLTLAFWMEPIPVGAADIGIVTETNIRGSGLVRES